MTLEEENEILRKNVHDLQEQLQNAYKRIDELTKPRETAPVDRNYKWWENVPVAPYDIGSK